MQMESGEYFEPGEIEERAARKIKKRKTVIKRRQAEKEKERHNEELEKKSKAISGEASLQNAYFRSTYVPGETFSDWKARMERSKQDYRNVFQK